MAKIIIIGCIVVASLGTLSGCEYIDKGYRLATGQSQWALVQRSLQASDDARQSALLIDVVGIYGGKDADKDCQRDLQRYLSFSHRTAEAGGIHRNSKPERLIQRKIEDGGFELRYSDNSGVFVDCVFVDTRWKTGF